MGVQRRVNWVSQQRVDVPDVRAIESAASSDFDTYVQALTTGPSNGYVIRGFEILWSGVIGGAASGIQVLVDPGAVLHVTSSQSGTFYQVPVGTSPQQLNSATNAIVDGAFAPNAINYVGLEYERFIDSTTQAQVYLWDPTANDETTKIAPRAQILRYRFKITTTVWASNVMPLFIVATDAGNNVTNVSDARNMLNSLGQGGANPNPFYQYPWTYQSEGRTPNSPSSSSNSVNPFHGGDKMLLHDKDWKNAVMTMFQEIKGTSYWTQSGNAGSLNSLLTDLGNTVTTGKGSLAHSPTTPGQMNWDQNLYLKIVGSRLNYQISANPSSANILLADDEVAYITLTRDQAIVPNLIFTNGSPIVSSVGAVSWTTNLQAGDWVKQASDTQALYFKVLSVDSTSQVTLTENYGGTSTGVTGAKAQYAFGVYQASASPSTARDIFIADREDVPSGSNIYWLFLRGDNGGVIPRVYVRFLGSELEQGESEEIDHQVPLQLLQYIGSGGPAVSKPQYVQSVSPGSVPQITQITTSASASMASGQYFLINSSGNSRMYYVWVKKDGVGTDPAPAANQIGIEWDISTGQTAAQTATALVAALTGTFYTDFSAGAISNVITVTNNSAGTAVNASNVSIGSIIIATTQAGTGTGNYAINDGDNLTLAAKKLDEAIANFAESLSQPGYDETVAIVASGATPPSSVNGPISIGTNVQLPLNSRSGNIQAFYVVGSGKLELFLNGQKMIVGIDYTEVGGSGTSSKFIQASRAFVVGDKLEFTFGGGGGGAGGGGQQGPPGPAGPQGPPGANAAGGPVTISTKTANYNVLLSDCFLKADCTSNSVTFTLPAAASAAGRIFYFKKIDVSANAMVIQANGSELIDGSNTQSTTVRWETFSLISDGTSWSIF